MNLVSKFKTIYNGKWELASCEKLSEDDLKVFKRAEVVHSVDPKTGEDYGLSVCFMMVNGQRGYFPLSINSAAVEEGEVLDLNTIEIETLSRVGSDDIYRVKVIKLF